MEGNTIGASAFAPWKFEGPINVVKGEDDCVSCVKSSNDGMVRQTIRDSIHFNQLPHEWKLQCNRVTLKDESLHRSRDEYTASTYFACVRHR